MRWHSVPDSVLNEIKESVKIAERKTSAEIRVLLESRCKGNVLDRAAFAFEKLNMHKTINRNGVLIYVSIDDHQCAIIGDSGIHQVVKDAFWNTVKNEMVVFFSAGQLKEGIIHAVNRAVEQLIIHFPIGPDDKNELPDSILLGLK
ncbi:MAG: TPM domain-containing protein [Bacteroidia bacterium]|nr:TPM domain-containing protein [Bacteroidia bacterium]MCZ2277721.1 TPM domain-containing protein [Bacteroidia bacterium]